MKIWLKELVKIHQNLWLWLYQHFSKPNSIQNFESEGTSSISEKMQTKQSFLSSKVSSSHQIPSYQTYTTSKLNEYINKLTLPYFNSFCQAFYIQFFYNIFDQSFVMKNFYNLFIKKLLKSRNDWLLIYCFLHYFSMCSKNSMW